VLVLGVVALAFLIPIGGVDAGECGLLSGVCGRGVTRDREGRYVARVGERVAVVGGVVLRKARGAFRWTIRARS
jgi:hypothetical protein